MRAISGGLGPLGICIGSRGLRMADRDRCVGVTSLQYRWSLILPSLLVCTLFLALGSRVTLRASRTVPIILILSIFSIGFFTADWRLDRCAPRGRRIPTVYHLIRRLGGLGTGRWLPTGDFLIHQIYRIWR